MKTVLISIRPKWCAKIVSGEKTVEVRKTRPKLDTPFKAYIYCSQGNDARRLRGSWGKVIGEFTCDRIYELAPLNHAPDDVEKQACLTREEIVNYLKGTGYGWHVMPADDVMSVVHGKWLRHYRSGVVVPEGWVSSCCDMWNERRSNYCPKCGAKMDGGGNDAAD